MTEIHLTEHQLPARLNDLRDTPTSLYLRGNVECLSMPAVAIVGSRACSSYGRMIARQWARELAAEGYVIVSGLARGIDGDAHRGALDAGGKTIAVLGCGIDRYYPAAHAELARRIETSGGALVSEYEPGVEPAPWRFPARNRIIAALGDSMLVVEARDRSGALIAADFALKIGRPLFAIPGQVGDGLAVGPNNLIQQGHATISLSPSDVITPTQSTIVD